jgi:hypothetical protein
VVRWRDIWPAYAVGWIGIVAGLMIASAFLRWGVW